jgi:aminoglycoside phosphotransferase (APT) family kinase protein
VDLSLARRALGLAPDARVEVRPLPAGTFHEHVLAVGPDGAEAVLRVPTGSQWGLPLAAQLDRERRTLEALVATGAAPAPLGLLADTDPPVLVEEHVAGRPFDPTRDRAALGRALAAVHAVPPPAHLPRVDARTTLLDETWARLRTAPPGEAHDLVAARAAELDPPGAAPRDLLGERVDPAVEAPIAELALVHTELHGGALVVAPDGRVRILDWEAARVAAPAWDLAHAVALAGDAGGEQELLAAYAAARGEPVADVTDRVRALRPAVVVRALARPPLPAPDAVRAALAG